MYTLSSEKLHISSLGLSADDVSVSPPLTCFCGFQLLLYLPQEEQLGDILDAFVRLSWGRSGLSAPRIGDILDEVLLPDVAGQQLLPNAEEPRAGQADDPNLDPSRRGDCASE